jgi:hypothetical protein
MENEQSLCSLQAKCLVPFSMKNLSFMFYIDIDEKHISLQFQAYFSMLHKRKSNYAQYILVVVCHHRLNMVRKEYHQFLMHL